MRVFILLWLLEALFAGLFIVAGHPRSTKRGFVFKMIAGALFLANGLYAFSLSGRTAYGVTILIGLAVGLAGDVFLTMDPFLRNRADRKLFVFFGVLGGAIFLVGHFVYMTAFLRILRAEHTFRFLPFAAAWGGMLLLIALVPHIARVSWGKFAFPVALYTAGISCMFALAFCTAVQAYAGQLLLQAMLIAAPVLFILSDTTLSLKLADRERFGALSLRAVSLCAYYLAQMLFGLTVLLQA